MFKTLSKILLFRTKLEPIVSGLATQDFQKIQGKILENSRWVVTINPPTKTYRVDHDRPIENPMYIPRKDLHFCENEQDAKNFLQELLLDKKGEVQALVCQVVKEKCAKTGKEIYRPVSSIEYNSLQQLLDEMPSLKNCGKI